MFRTTAHLYDLIYEGAGKDYAAESEELHRLIQDRNPAAATLLDVACGTGAHLAHLRRWYDVTGVDVDPAMLAQARRRLPDTVALVEADMCTFSLGRRFDAVTCLFSSVGYLHSVADLHAAVAAMAGHLAHGGVLVVDGWVRPEAWHDPGRVDVQVVERAEVTVVRVTRSVRAGRTTRLDMHHLVASLSGIDHLVDTHILTLFEAGDYRAALAGAGLHADVVAGPMADRDRYVAVRT